MDIVVNLKEWKITHPAWRYDDHTIYIGRRASGLWLPKSTFANPFKMEPKKGQTRDVVCDRFEAETLPGAAIQRILRRLALHEDYTFVCSCAPLRCHGESLVRQRAIWREEERRQ